MRPLISHIDLRVRDLPRAVRFYDAILNAVGFYRVDFPEHRPDEPTWRRRSGWISNDEFFGLTVDPEFRANENRIAFYCASRAEVDALTNLARENGARDMDGPAEYDGYYASFFEDPDGNKLELCYIEKHGGLTGEPAS